MTAATEGDETTTMAEPSLAPPPSPPQQPSPLPPSSPSSSSHYFSVDWDPGLDAYLSACFGASEWQRTRRALASAPLSTCLRLASAADAATAVARAESRGWEAFRVCEPAGLARLNVVLVREREREREKEEEEELRDRGERADAAGSEDAAAPAETPPPTAAAAVRRHCRRTAERLCGMRWPTCSARWPCWC